jgi:SM-20-related protein
MHYAVYPPGKFYQKHLDSFQGSNRRKISFVLYLNQDWQTEQGGQLRLYLEDDQIKDVNPEGGTLVCFVSSELYHEVLITTQTRYSPTGWMRHDRLEDMLLNY